jgi:hypothetical protein
VTALTWIAGADGLAHASRPGHARTLCQAKAQDPRWAWPELSRCADCQAIAIWPTVHRVDSHAPAVMPPAGARVLSVGPRVALSSRGPTSLIEKVLK